MVKFAHLVASCSHYRVVRVPDGGYTNARTEIDELIPINVNHDGAMRSLDVDRETGGRATGDDSIASLMKCL